MDDKFQIFDLIIFNNLVGYILKVEYADSVIAQFKNVNDARDIYYNILSSDIRQKEMKNGKIKFNFLNLIEDISNGQLQHIKIK